MVRYATDPQDEEATAARIGDRARAGGVRMRSESAISLRGDDLAAFERARQRGYIVARRSEGAALLAWYAWCRNRRLPCLRVQPKIRYSLVELDLEPSGSHYSR